ncbi:ER membrane protein, conserved in fungi plants and protozoa [Schizosaccharomyces pombe]|uniref:Uncharacterized protein SPBC1E8.03c n=1 Tax=Schizosaccharomyces pombe (strain 972 / ATCC 24843) TaxID=284812 RepID=YB93_SCHPO
MVVIANKGALWAYYCKRLLNSVTYMMYPLIRKRTMKKLLLIVGLLLACSTVMRRIPLFHESFHLPSLDPRASTTTSQKFQEYRSDFLEKLETAEPPEDVIMFTAYGLGVHTHNLFMLACDMAKTSDSQIRFLLLTDGTILPEALYDYNRETVSTCPLSFLSYSTGVERLSKELILKDLLSLQFQQALLAISPSVIVTSEHSPLVMFQAINPYLNNNYYTHDTVDTNALEENSWITKLDMQSLQHFRTPRINVVLIVEDGTYKYLLNLMRDLGRDFKNSEEYPHLFIHLFMSENIPNLSSIRANWPQHRLFINLHFNQKDLNLIEVWTPPNDYTYALVVDLQPDSPPQLSSNLITWLKYKILLIYYHKSSSTYKNNIAAIVPSFDFSNEEAVILSQTINSNIVLFAPVVFQKFQEYMAVRLLNPNFELPESNGIEFAHEDSVLGHSKPSLTEFHAILGLYSLVISYNHFEGSLSNELRLDNLIAYFLKNPSVINFEEISEKNLYFTYDSKRLSFQGAKNESKKLYNSVTSCPYYGSLSSFPIRSIFCEPLM